MTNIVNGVDVDALGATIAAVRTDPVIADFEFRLVNQWIDGGMNRSTIDDFRGARQEMRHAVVFQPVNDEPAVLLSGDKGPNPVEYVLHALAGCLTTTLVYHAAARGITVRGVRTRFTAPLDLHGFLGLREDVRRGFQSIKVMFDIDADLDRAGKDQLVAMAQKYSPVFDMVSNGVPVTCLVSDAAAMPKAA
jgi:uncharacterized OsmC-like protein